MWGVELPPRRDRPQELPYLLRDFLISVTSFFRDREAFDALAGTVIPRLFEGKRRDEQVRVWVAGCATGEEAYSIGMLLREHAAALRDAPLVQIFATDIDEDALAEGRAGRYPTTIAADGSPERLQRGQVHAARGHVALERIIDRLRDRLAIRIRDDGDGIAADLLPRIFDIFVQSRGVHRPSQSGLGIGL